MAMFGQSGGNMAYRFDPTQLSPQDKLMLLGATLRDTGAGLRGGESDAVLQAQQLLAGRQMMAARQQLFGQLAGGGMGDGSGSGGGITPGLAAQADYLGIPLTSSLKVMELNKPQYEEGVRVNPLSPTAPTFIPKRTEGVQPNFSPSGQLSGMSVIPGAPDAVGTIAGAQANAQEAAKAGYNLVDVPMSDGSTVKMPAAIAAPLLARQAASRFMPGAGPQGGASGATDVAFGQSQTPAAAELAKQRATTQGQRESLLPKQNAMLGELDNRSALTSQIIHQILGDVPTKDGGWAPGGKPMIGAWTAGIGANLAGLKGTPAHNLEAQLDHVRAMTALDELEKLREDSPTGAGLGRVTQQEINLLAAMRGSIDQGQSPGQLAQNLRRQLGQLDQIRANRHQEYQQTYGNIEQPTPGSAQPKAPAYRPNIAAIPLQDRIAEAKRRGLIP